MSALLKYKESIVEILYFTCFCDFCSFDVKGIFRKKALVKKITVVIAIRNDDKGNTKNVEKPDDNNQESMVLT